VNGGPAVPATGAMKQRRPVDNLTSAFRIFLHFHLISLIGRFGTSIASVSAPNRGLCFLTNGRSVILKKDGKLAAAGPREKSPEAEPVLVIKF